MIEIKRNENSVRLEFSCWIPWVGTRTYFFDWNCGTEDLAGLLTQHLKEALVTSVEAIRRESYEKGWKDAKAHRAKKDDWFSGSL